LCICPFSDPGGITRFARDPHKEGPASQMMHAASLLIIFCLLSGE
jgi:hypothetical protein